jgi:hypothetical protein
MDLTDDLPVVGFPHLRSERAIDALPSTAEQMKIIAKRLTPSAASLKMLLLPAAIGAIAGGRAYYNRKNRRDELRKALAQSGAPMSKVSEQSFGIELEKIAAACGMPAKRRRPMTKKASLAMQSGFNSELEKVAIFGAIRKMFSSGAGDAVQAAAAKGAAHQTARFGVPKQVIGATGSGQPLGRSAAEVQKILAQRRTGGLQDVVNQRALSASPAQRQAMVRSQEVARQASPGGRVDFGNNPVRAW